MQYKSYSPHPLLSPYIRCYWTLESTGNTAPVSKDRIFPDGCVEMVFHFGDLFRKYKPEQIADLQPRSFVHGQLKRYMEIEATGKTGIFSVRFAPDGLSPFINLDLKEITDEQLSIQDCWGKEGDVLEDKILNAVSHEQRIGILENFLLQKLSRAKENNKAIAYCVHAIIRTDGNITIDKLASELNIGRRHLERRFISSVGVSPKLLSRITRFQHILQLIENKESASLTAIAYEGGFYDQAHFIKDFKEFTGLNPKQYFSEDLSLVKYFSFG